MKKNTFILLLLLLYTALNYGQCINTNAYPSESIVSDNSGDFQEINTCVYTGDYSTISNITVGSTYTFELRSEGQPVEKYITVTDVSNNVLAQGASPLIVNAISQTSVRLHYTEDAACGTAQLCLGSYFKVTLACPFPTAIQITGVTTTNATFNWTPGDAETMWEVLVLPASGDAPSANTIGTAVTANPTYTYTALQTGQSYKFYIRANCGNDYSPWRGPYVFNSACDPITVFTENFDASTDASLPSCWTGLLLNAPSTEASITINSLSNSTPNAVQLANGNSGPAAQILLISPKLSTVGTATHRLKFYTRGYGNVTLQVGTINSTTSDAVFNSLETINGTANYTEHIVDFTGYTGTDTFVAFKHANTSSYNPVFIDDVKWEPAPSCPDVAGIETINLTQNTATIGWIPNNTPTAWDVVYSETATDPTTLTPIASAENTPSVLISGLQPNTTYKAWVRSSCDEGADKGAWMNPISFTTPCAATSVLNEGFENDGYGSLPDCWSSILSGDLLNSNIGINTNNGFSSSNAVELYNGDESAGSQIILVSPSLSTLVTGTHHVKFYARSNGAATVEVGTLDSPASGATFSDYQTINTTSNYTEYVVDFSTYVGTDTYFGFKNTSGQYVSIYIDDVRWDVTPLCADVTEVAVNGITAAAATVSWTANAGENQWDVVYGSAAVTDPSTLTPISPAPSNTSTTTLSGLTDNTVYKVWVRSACGGTEGNGAWIGPIAFRTACLPTANFNEGFETSAYGELPDCWSRVLSGPTLGQYAAVRTVTNDAAFGSNAVEIHANSSAPTDFVMLVSPYLSTLATATHRLKFYALSYNTDTPLEIGTMDGNNSTSTYTPFTTFTLGSGYNEIIVDFTTYTGTDTYIAFRNVAGNYNSIFIDNVRWEVLPTCADVSVISVQDVTAEAASVYWTPTGTESNWQVAYGLASVSDPYLLTPSPVIGIPSFELENLTANTTYNVWVRSVCGGTDGNGSWIGPIDFTTGCLATTVPYTQNFESVTLPAVPECTTVESSGNLNDWDTTYGDTGYGFDGYVLRYNGNSAQANAWFFTQGLELTGGMAYTISYKYGNNSSDNYSENLHVLYGTDANPNAMTQEIGDHLNINNGMAMTNEVDFIPATTGVYYFGFQAWSTANQSQLFLDNIVVEGSLATPVNDYNTFSFYPNPVKDVLNISSTAAITQVTVYNLLGQNVLETSLNSSTTAVDLSGLPKGTYLVKILTATVSKTIKVIKN
ncbi:choice-of-anchor J domain-containing protein [Flavobacterium sp. SM2513]|uniref:choice-of-anchor J domain-containing protein n=1 Tax=Flavobacterium sp. SM2513 TaxID=3424766 RepID=UPI003D7FC838